MNTIDDKLNYLVENSGSSGGSESSVFCCTFSLNSGKGTKFPIQYLTFKNIEYINDDIDEIYFLKIGKYRLQMIGTVTTNNAGCCLNVYLDNVIIKTYSSNNVNLDINIEITKENTVFYFTNNTYEALYGAFLITKL